MISNLKYRFNNFSKYIPFYFEQTWICVISDLYLYLLKRHTDTSVDIFLISIYIFIFIEKIKYKYKYTNIQDLYLV